MRTVTDMAVSAGVKSLVSRAHLIRRNGSAWPSVWQLPKARVPRCHVAAHQPKGRGPSSFWPITLLAYIRATVPRLPHRTPHFRHFQPLSLLPPELLRRRSSPKPFSPANFCGDRTAQLRLSPFLACATLFLSNALCSSSFRAAARRRRSLPRRTSAAVSYTHLRAHET